jgi:putative transposase
MDTINQMCLAALPGYAPRGTKDRAGQAQLTLAELDAAIGRFIVDVYNRRAHSETGQPPQDRWEAGGFLPRMPESLEQLDLLLLTVTKQRKLHPDGIHFQGLRYIDPVLAAYVGEDVVVRYDPRDLAEIRVYHRGRYLCRAICPDLAGTTVSLKDIAAARNARRRELRRQLSERATVVDRLIAVHTPASPLLPPTATGSTTQAGGDPPAPRLRRYREE